MFPRQEITQQTARDKLGPLRVGSCLFPPYVGSGARRRAAPILSKERDSER